MKQKGLLERTLSEMIYFLCFLSFEIRAYKEEKKKRVRVMVEAAFDFGRDTKKYLLKRALTRHDRIYSSSRD